MTDAVFVGRADELARFRALLTHIPVGKPSRLPRRSRGKKATTDRRGAATSRVVLVHGPGGSGKSRLLRQFQEMADGRHPESPVAPSEVLTVFLDWEDAQREQPALYADVEGPSLVTVLDAVQRTVIGAFGTDAGGRDRAGRAFTSYREGAARTLCVRIR